jgi:hypothetical protein
MSDMSLEQLLGELAHEEAPPEFDWNAPEAGQFAPAVVPGSYEFVFHLRTDAGVGGFDKVKVQDKHYLAVVFDGEVLVPGESEPKKLTYQRVNRYKHEKVAISSLGELLRCLGIHLTLGGNPTDGEIVRALQAQSGRARGRGEVAWRYYCKAHGLTISTSPRKRKGVKDLAWPREADGKPVLTVQCPTCGANSPKAYGQAEFIRYFQQQSS